MHLFATAAAGTEGALRDELKSHRFRGVRADRGGVHFEGDLAEAGRACVESRIAVRVLVELGAIDAKDERALYDGVRSIDWTPWLTPKHTMAVSSVSRASKLFHTKYLAQKTKDAIVDQLRDELGARPSVDTEDADVRVFLHLVKDRGTLFLDASGESLHRRGWRTSIVEAPLKETLAAACLRLAEWDRARPFCDPMCGSGTIAIEAALWARDVAPGLTRARFGLERWASMDETLARAMKDTRARARARVRRSGPAIFARDVDASAIAVTEANARRAGVDLDLKVQDIRDLDVAGAVPTNEGGALVLTNPPYGERLVSSRELYEAMATSLRKLRGSRVAFLSSDRALEAAMKRKPTRWQSLWNGALEVRLSIYDIL